jgi:hypothetical protein
MDRPAESSARSKLVASDFSTLTPLGTWLVAWLLRLSENALPEPAVARRRSEFRIPLAIAARNVLGGAFYAGLGGRADEMPAPA